MVSIVIGMIGWFWEKGKELMDVLNVHVWFCKILYGYSLLCVIIYGFPYEVMDNTCLFKKFAKTQILFRFRSSKFSGVLVSVSLPCFEIFEVPGYSGSSALIFSLTRNFLIKPRTSWLKFSGILWRGSPIQNSCKKISYFFR